MVSLQQTLLHLLTYACAKQVDRESRILSDAYPYIASRLLTDSAPELQGALQQLLFKDGKPRWVSHFTKNSLGSGTFCCHTQWLLASCK